MRRSAIPHLVALLAACGLPAADATDGPVSRGREVFDGSRARCSSCHSVDGTGEKPGPDLRGIAEKLDRAGLRKALLEPSADILPGYSAVVVVTTSGEVHEGVLRRVGEREIELRSAAGEVIRVPRSRIREQRAGEASLMPEGLEAALEEGELRDLLSYLETLRLPPSAAAAHPGSPATIPRAAVPARLVPFHPPEMELHRPVWIGPLPGRPGNYLAVEVERARIWRLEKSSSGDRMTLFADLFEETRHGYVEGLLGMAFHPRFAENRRYFIKMHQPGTGEVVMDVLERRASADGLRDSGEPSRRVLTIPMPHVNHNGGSLAFGPDGLLHIGVGDGGPQEDPDGHGQDLGSLLGKILRIDVDRRDEGLPYAIPPSNPFRGRPGARPEVWALGFREPWRISFDPDGAGVWVGDVGQERFEQVALARAGENHGWNVLEGFAPYSSRYRREGERYVPPVLSYSRRHGVSVTGGHVYRGSRAPGLRGAYVFGDFESRRIWALRHEDRRLRSVIEIARAPSRIASFGEDAGGELLVVGHDPGMIYLLDVEEIDLAPVEARSLAATSEEAGIPWRMARSRPAEGWAAPDFDDSRWEVAPGGFGTEGTPGAIVRTEWRGQDIWIRRRFRIETADLPLDPASTFLRIHHDDDAEIHLNGVLAASPRRWTSGYVEMAIVPEALRALRPGENVIAIHCRQGGGGQYIDAGIIAYAPGER